MIDEDNIDSRIEGGNRVAFSKEMFRGLSPADSPTAWQRLPAGDTAGVASLFYDEMPAKEPYKGAAR